MLTKSRILTIKKSSYWKLPGKEKVTNFWLKHTVSIHEDMSKAYTNIIENPEGKPEWLTEGLTYLKQKRQQTQKTASLLPVSQRCTRSSLPLLQQEPKHSLPNTNFHQQNVQKRCKKGRCRCKDQLLISKWYGRNVRQRKRIDRLGRQ